MTAIPQQPFSSIELPSPADPAEVLANPDLYLDAAERGVWLDLHEPYTRALWLSPIPVEPYEEPLAFVDADIPWSVRREALCIRARILRRAFAQGLPSHA